MKQLWRFSVLAVVMMVFSAEQCTQKEMKNNEVLQKLYDKYRFGQIEECTYEGQKVYHAGINAFDAGSQVYDSTGKSIATCNYATRMVDPACEKLSECEAVYRCANHINGQPAVDKYGLAKNNESPPEK